MNPYKWPENNVNEENEQDFEKVYTDEHDTDMVI